MPFLTLFPSLPPLPSPLLPPSTGRGDKIKTARADAASTIAAYRSEKAAAFDQSAASAGGAGREEADRMKSVANREMGEMKVSFGGGGRRKLGKGGSWFDDDI